MLVELSHAEAEVIGLANMRSLVDNYRAEHEVEMYINLDHSPSLEAAKAGIDAGFEFIHIDYAVVRLIGPVICAVQDVVENRIDLFGATGKARR